MPNAKNALIIFVRKPELGKVKTRLAATIGNEAALQVYQELLLHTKDVSVQVVADKFVYYHEELEEQDIWGEPSFYRLLQPDGDLGYKMNHAFNQLFSNGYKRIIVIGSDCFELTPAIVQQGYDSLLNHEAVIGPAADGGYYLLGLTKELQQLFTNKDWSTSSVFEQTVQDFNAANLRYTCLPVLSDIDNEEDLIRHRQIKSD